MSAANPKEKKQLRKGGNDFLKPLLSLPATVECDAAGIVEEVGSEVINFRKGDEVFGIPNFPGSNLSYAEYCPAKARPIELKPKSISINEAAGVPLVVW